MREANLPVGLSDGRRLPTRHDNAGMPASDQTRPRALELLQDEPREERDEVDLLAYWRILVKRRWLVLGVLAAIAALTLLKTLLTPPTYRATATMQIDREALEVVKVEGMAPVEGATGYDFYQTQYELLKSRTLAERVANELHLDETALSQLRPPSWSQQLVELLRPPKDVVGQKNVKSGAQAAQLRAAVGVVRRGLVVEPIRNSRLVRINFDSPQPAFSARVVNALAGGFIDSAIERKFGASSYARKYLEDQLKQIKGRLEQSERELVGFAQKENIVNAINGQSMASQNLTELNTALAEAQSQRMRAQARWHQAQRGSGAALPADMLEDSILRILQQQRAQLQGQFQDRIQVFKPAYPAMQQLKGQIDELDKQIGAELANIRASIGAEYEAAQSQEDLLVDKLASLRGEALDVDKRSIRYTILKREVDTNRQLYDGLLQRYKEIGVAGGIGANNISIVDRAEIPTRRFKPNLPRNLSLGILSGLFLGVLMAFLLEYLDDTLKSPEDIEQRLRLAVLGIIPKLGKQSFATASADLRSGFSEAYRSVRTSLQFATDRGVPKVLLITSPGPSEGKSTTALTLARNFAQLGKRVLLIEADLRHPSLHKVLDLRVESGLSNLLAGAAAISDVVMDTADARLQVILAGPLPPNPAELLAGSKLISLLAVTAEKYDLVVIDGPPVLGIADAPVLANAADATLLMVHSGRTRIATAQAAVKRLAAARARLIGALLTQYDARAAGYGYGYGDGNDYYAYGTSPRLTKT